MQFHYEVLKLMIDLNLYRIRIGSYNKGSFIIKKRRVLGGWDKGTKFGADMRNYEFENSLIFNSSKSFVSFYILCSFFIFALMGSSLTISSLNSFPRMSNFIGMQPSLSYFRINMTYVLSSLVNVAYLYIFSSIVRIMAVGHRGRPGSRFRAKLLNRKSSRLGKFVSFLFIALLILNFLLIAISNPSIMNPGPSNLSIFYQNTQGLIPFSCLRESHPSLDRAKIYELNAHINDTKPDIILLTETWLKRCINDQEVIHDTVYNVFRNDRSQVSHPEDPSNPEKYKKNGGGVLIAVRSDLKAEIKRISVRKGAEMAAIELTINQNKFIFCVIYRVGTLGSENHASIISTIKALYSSKRPKKLFIVGDMNLSTANWSTTSNPIASNATDRLFIDSFHEFDLTQCITSPTHIKGKILDLLLTNSASLLQNVQILSNTSICKSDHFPITFEVSSHVKYIKPPKRKILNFKRADWDALNKDLSNVNWSNLIDCAEPELSWRTFKSILFKFIEKHIPTITIKMGYKSPWFDSESNNAYMKKKRAHEKWKETNGDLEYIRFSAHRRNFKALSDKKLNDNLYNSDDPAMITKKFWSHVKFTSKSTRIPEKMYLGYRFRSAVLDKANLFNTFFYDQFSDPSNYNIDIDWSDDNILYDIEFSESRIKGFLSMVNSNKASGPDGIHGKILKNCADSLAAPLSILFKLSYNTGSIPADWKLAHIVPVHKKGCKENIENYRPISLTSLVMKTFERVIKEELLIRTRLMLDQRQHDFLANKSCNTNMAHFTDNVALSLNECSTISVDVIYFDFAKAFDSVNHDLILEKLKNQYKIEGRLLKFVRNYLCERKQCVQVGGKISESKPVLSGVPQGSILGPILFVLFVNDLPIGLNDGTNLALYADDTKIWRPIKSYSDHLQLQGDIKCLNNWASKNKMRFNLEKCKAVSIANRKSPVGMLPIPFIKFQYFLGDDPLDYAESEKDLGVIVEVNFRFNSHIEKILSKAKQQFGLTKRTCSFVNDRRRRRALYLTLVRSQFEHCSSIWRPTNKVALDKMEAFQRKCIRWIISEEFVNYDSYSTYLEKCRQIDILPISKKFDLNDLILFHKVVNNFIPLQMPEYLTLFSGNTRLRSTHLDRLCFVSSVLPRNSNKGILEKSFFYRTHSLWNSLPLDIREITCPSIFKRRLIDHLWKQLASQILEDNQGDLCLSDSEDK